MARAELVEHAERFARYLGDPHDPGSPMSFARVLDLDEREQYPHELLALAQRWGLHHWMVPDSHGGKAVNVEDGFQLMRLLARRDATTCTALVVTTIGYLPVWVAGDEEQRAYYSRAVLDGMKMAWGFSEREHGSDVIANEVVAERVEGGYRLNGEKWLIGNATVADAVTVFARTKPEGGPAGFSIFIVEKRKLLGGAVEPLPNEHLHGLRGIDMSGVRLHDVVVPESARIGREGAGLEIALKSGQTVRACIACVALGCTETALRLAGDFAMRREIFGTRVSAIPYSRRQLAECFADLLVAEAVSVAAVRSLQVCPAQSSLFSSIAKYFVPTTLERTISQAGIVLGARHWLRADARYGAFQKAMRDVGVTGFADGNTVVNLKNVAAALERLLDNAAEAPERLRDEARIRARTLFDLDADLPPYRPWEQQLFSRGADDAVLALPESLDVLRDRAREAAEPEARWLTTVVELGTRLHGQLGRLRTEVKRLREDLGGDYGQSAELFDLAKQYCVVHAAAACVNLLAHSSDELGHLGSPEAVGALCLERLWQHFAPAERLCDRDAVEATAATLEDMLAGGRLLSWYPIGLAESPLPTELVA